MKTLNYFFKISLIAILFISFSSQAQSDAKSSVFEGNDLETFSKAMSVNTGDFFNGDKLTVFTPTNAAFENLSTEKYVEMPSDSKLRSTVYYHVVQGNLKSSDLKALIKEKGGRAMLKTLEGTTLTVSENSNGDIFVVDNLGRVASVSEPDLSQGNVIYHKIDKVLLPARNR